MQFRDDELSYALGKQAGPDASPGLCPGRHAEEDRTIFGLDRAICGAGEGHTKRSWRVRGAIMGPKLGHEQCAYCDCYA